MQQPDQADRLMAATDAESSALGKLLLIQHALEVLPNETSIASFLYQSLSTLPGVKDVHVCLRDVVTPDDARYRELCRAAGDSGAAPATPPRTRRFPLRTLHHVYGALFLAIDNENQFAFYQPYLANTANIVATLLEGRDHVQQLNAADEGIQRGRDALEVQAQQRAADLLRTNEELQRELAERQLAEENNRRLTQLYAALAQCNEAIVHSTREEELFPIVCRSAVDFGGMRTAWIGLVDPASRRVVPVASYGEGTDYLDGIEISADATDPFGHGPAGIAIRGKQPYWCQDYQHDPATAPWHERAARFGWRAVAALPLQRNGATIGIFGLSADRVNAFDPAARKLLLEMAGDISFALDNFAHEAERQQAQAELADSKNLLQSILDTVPVRIFWKDKELRYLGCNIAFARDAGEASPADLLGKDDYQLGWKAQAELYRADDRRVTDSGIPRLFYDEPQTTPDGKTIWLRTSKVPLRNAANETIGVIGLYEDITERKRVEEEIRTLNADLERRVAERTQQLEEANRAKSSFLATMSHEIRTPLGGMMGMLELLSMSPLGDEQRETLQAARDSGRSLLRILNDVLDWSKIEEGKLELAPQATSIAGLMAEVAKTYAHVASGNRVTLAQQVDTRLSPTLTVDPLRLSQVLNNFVSNAIKFNRPGGRVELRAELIGAREGAEEVRFSVEDTGIGIDLEAQARLFQRYGQASADTARMYGGTGLGLAICRRLADLMQGRIDLDSEPGRGSTFSLTLTLPLTKTEVDPRQGRATTPVPAAPAWPPVDGAAAANALLVLVVDDHPINRKLLARQIGLLGLRAETAQDGEEALSLWRDGRYALVITDCHMPQMDGYELAHAIRRIEADEARARTPIFAWTANALADEIERCEAAGMDELLVKPAELVQLKGMLEKWLPTAAQAAPDQPEAPPAPQAAAAPPPLDLPPPHHHL